MLPRARLLLVEGKVERALKHFEAEAAEVSRRGEAALREQDETPRDFDAALTDLEDAMRRALEDLVDEAGRVDQVLLKKTAGAEKELMRAIDRLRDHGRRAMDRVTGRDQDRREKVMAHLRPEGKPQERVLSPLTFLTRHGMDLLGRLLSLVEERPDGGFVVYLASRRA